MSELEYIEDYFSARLSEGEKQAFEKRCEADDMFAEEVSFYILTRQHFQEELASEKKKEFLDLYDELKSKDSTSSGRQRSFYSYITAAAACVLLLIAYLAFFQDPAPEKLASRYIAKNLSTMSTTMSPATDSLAMGIGAFNQKDYESAEAIFRSLEKKESLTPETTEYLGITYLNTGDYEKAIDQFNKLISYTELYANPGKFYLAITLMKRAQEGDHEQAKKLLGEVVAKKLPGYKEASDWIEHL